MTKSILPALAAFLLFPVASTQAAVLTFNVPLSGAQEAPGPGDPDGFGLAVLTIDDVALTISWNITFDNILTPLTGAHIHRAPVGVPGPIVVDFDSQATGGPISDPDLAAVIAAPWNHYVNLHNDDFRAGAIRGQLAAVPEPSSLTMGVLGLAAVLMVFNKSSRRTR